MKRMLITVCLVCMAYCNLMAQKPISDFLNIPGRMKSYYSWRDKVELKKNTPCTLLFLTKLKQYESEEGAYQAVMTAGGKQFYVPLDLLEDYFQVDVTDNETFWTMALLEMYKDYYKKDELAALRQELRQDAESYLSELEKSSLFYDDAAIEDYLQCQVLSLMPERDILKRGMPKPVVRLLKSAAPDMMMLGNGTLLVSTGMLAALDTEDELRALLLREISHYLMDHALFTIKQNVARANRAAFWGAVADGVVAAAEMALYERYDYYQPGLLFETNGVIQALVNEKITKRMGLDYSPKFEEEADELAITYLQSMGKSKDALTSALQKVYAYYKRENDVETLSKYGVYGTLEERLARLGEPTFSPIDRNFLTKMMGVVSFEAAMQDYNKQYRNAQFLAMKNIDNGLACADDYLMVARSLMKQSNTPESNAECLLYLDKADLVAKVENVNITKMRILLLIRENMKVNTVDMLKKYQEQLNFMFQQPHTEEDAEWIAAEHLWAEKLLERIYLN